MTHSLYTTLRSSLLTLMAASLLACGGTLGSPMPDEYAFGQSPALNRGAGDTDSRVNIDPAGDFDPSTLPAGDETVDVDEQEICGSGFDEDSDGLYDCDDSDCWFDGGGCEELCDSDSDEDGDGAVACADSDCWGAMSECEEICNSGNDEDSDGMVDCDDDDCWLPGVCEQQCDSPDDQDGDGFFACDDSDCADYLDCITMPNYQDHIRGILAAKCGPCHTGGGKGGTNFASVEGDTLKASSSCEGLNIAACIIGRTESGEMPPSRGCTGDPELDAGNGSCLQGVELEAIIRWVDGDAP